MGILLVLFHSILKIKLFNIHKVLRVVPGKIPNVLKALTERERERERESELQIRMSESLWCLAATPEQGFKVHDEETWEAKLTHLFFLSNFKVMI